MLDHPPLVLKIRNNPPKIQKIERKFQREIQSPSKTSGESNIRRKLFRRVKGYRENLVLDKEGKPLKLASVLERQIQNVVVLLESND